jgi:transcriptional regulator with XRE-family HTH domain
MTNRGSELGKFLRAHRGAVRPADVGLPEGVRARRTPGLRREELASLAGVSVDYYTRLEQGKELRPGPAVVDALATVLRLSPEEHEHLRALATRPVRSAPDPARPAEEPSRRVRPGMLRLLEALRPNPAYVTSRTNDVLAANPAGLGLLAGIEEWPAARRNIIRYVFLHPQARQLYVDWERLLPGSVAHLRAMAGVDPDAPDLVQLVGELTVKSSRFASLWERYEVGVSTDGVKRFRHPVVGEMSLGYEAMSLARTDGQRLIAYHAAEGSPDYDAVVLLDMASAARADETRPSSGPVSGSGSAPARIAPAQVRPDGEDGRTAP